MQYLKALNDPLSGCIAECGCFKGLSSYLIASYLDKIKSNSNLEFHIFDSFEGLSEKQELDNTQNKIETKGLMRCSLEDVQKNLSMFSFITYHKGWIPACFNEIADDKKYKFVNIDLDLYQPIKDSLEYFYPKLLDNAYIVIDDYGVKKWAGVEKAVEEFVAKYKCPCIRTTLGTVVLSK